MYPTSDMLIRIKNAQSVNKDSVIVPSSRVKMSIAQILKDNNFIDSFEKRKKKGKRGDIEYIWINLKYNEDKTPAISGFKIISKPSRHMYISAKGIKLVRSGYGISVLSTSKGIMSSKDARKNNLGGEILFEVW